MRLTLRVLLAYLDNILEPGDAKAVEAKIAESENVSTLVHHIREITKRMRIGAPEVLGKGLGLDPNTVAEYLDYGLSDDGVRDFENVCMTSDVHMAEVAACHEILSLVLVKPADIDPQARQRMYGLLHEPQAAPLKAEPVREPLPTAVPVSAGGSQRPASVAMSAPAEARRKAEVPDYLRQPEEAPVAQSGPSLVTAALILIALGLLGSAAALALVPYDNLPGFAQPLAEKIFDRKPPAAVVLIDEPGTALPLPTATGEAVLPRPSSTLPLLPTAPTATVPVPLATAPRGTVTSVAGSTVVVPVAAASGTAAGAGTGLRQPDSALNTAATAPAASTVAPAPPVPGSMAPGTAISGSAAAGTMTPPNPAATGSPSVTATPAVSGQPLKIEQVGRVSSDLSQVLLRFDPQSGWMRVQPRDAISVGDRLLALPGYRPQVALGNGLTFDLLGGTAVEVLPVDTTGIPGLRLLRGRLMMFTVGGPKTQLTLEDGAKRVALTLGGAEVALEHVFRRYVGTDPAAAPLPWALVVTVKSGEVGWSVRPGDSQKLTGPGQWLWTDSTDLSPLAGGAAPLWMTADERDLLERQAADYVEITLRGGKAVKVALEELIDDRRSENQQLALRCLAQLGMFDDYMPPLNDPTQRYSTWERYLNYLAEAQDWGPFYAEGIRSAMVKQHGPVKGSELYRMLWSYDDEQLKGGMAKYLVETLDHENLDFRTIAYWNLVRITGLSIAFTPQDPPIKRKLNIQKWAQKLDMGQIVHKVVQ
ncbi:MAG: hypothetical protein C0483_25710 [Pirellula sp.]|nr:hypothetical protein [Pirellula sp.]